MRQLFGCDYTTSYERAGLLGPRSVLAHNVHPTLPELLSLAHHGAAVAHCPTSNAALGSGLFPLGLPPRARRPGRARHRRRRRHRLLAVQGGAAGLLRPAAAGPRGPPALGAAPAAPGHVRRRRRAGALDGHRRLLGRQGVRRPLAAAPARLDARRRAAARGLAPRTRWPRRSRWPGPLTSPRRGWAATRSTRLPEPRRPTRSVVAGGEQVEQGAPEQRQGRGPPRQPSLGAPSSAGCAPGSTSSQSSTVWRAKPAHGPSGSTSERAYASTQSTSSRRCSGAESHSHSRAVTASRSPLEVLEQLPARRGGRGRAARGPGPSLDSNR